jgi:hypothetical protein
MSNSEPVPQKDSRIFRFFRGKDDLAKVNAELKHVGLGATLRFIFSKLAARTGWLCYYLYHRSADRRFDRVNGVETCGVTFNDNLAVVGNNRESGLEYEPTPVGSFDRMLAEVHDDFGEFTFIDFGCGKGRTLLLASHHNFRTIRGVEFVQELQQIANQNIEAYASGKQRCRDVSAVLCDAAEFAIPDDKCLFYFYFPFREDVLRIVMNNIVTSYQQNPRKMYFIVRLDKSDWTEVSQRVFGEHPALKAFGKQPDLSRVRFMPFDVIYYAT